MNRPDTEVKRHGIIVIQSLGDDDKKTGTILYEDILRYKNYINADVFCEFYDANTKEELALVLVSICDSLLEGDTITLHIETHGHDEGIYLRSGETMSWREFFDLTRPINIKIGNLLFIVMAMCRSIALISDIDYKKRSPYFAFICTTRNVAEDVILRGFEAFYQEYCNILDSRKALNALRNEVDDVNEGAAFQILTAGEVFSYAFNNDQRDISDMVINCLQLQHKEINENNIIECTYQLRMEFKGIYDEYNDFYNFRDVYDIE